MLNSLFPHVDWKKIRIAGFDLDGTLYDEAEFIVQVYRPISQLLSAACHTASCPINSQMLRRWMEMGSSYNRIFDEILGAHGISGAAADPVITQCLALFRGFEPVLTLPARVSLLLDWMKESLDFFLVSDGAAALQMQKFGALGLQRWFSLDNVSISGCNDPGFEKPSLKMLRNIAVLQAELDPGCVVYFGDRDIDRQFAEAAGFQFVRVSCLLPKMM
jgi:FMN phosphatase YigB (HAD superfamily)